MHALSLPPENRTLFARLRSVWWTAKDELDSWCFTHCRPIWWAAHWVQHNWHNQVVTRLWPRQRWLTRQVSRQWTDKPELLSQLLYALVIHFVEEEDCFNVTAWAASGLVEEEKQLRSVYAWAKTGRAAFQKRIDDAHPPFDMSKTLADFVTEINRHDPVRDAAYKEVQRLEEEFERIDGEHLMAIIKIRATLWT